MKLSERVSPHLPYLRRFARALTGSQVSGDSYVAAMLESVIADPRLVTENGDTRVALYRALCSIWGSLSVNRGAESGAEGWEHTVQDRLARIPGLARQVYLLQSLEGFEPGAVASILQRPVSEIAELYQNAANQIAGMIASDVLIIEDEPLIALDIEDLVRSMGHRVMGVARTRGEALRITKTQTPQLILSDIQLADGSSGIDAVNDMLKSFNVPVIFITAFPERLLTGEKPEPAFLITKPFSPDMVKGVIAQALFFDVKSRKAA